MLNHQLVESSLLPGYCVLFESLVYPVSNNRYSCPKHAHEYKEKRKRENRPRFALLRWRRESVSLLFALGHAIDEQASFLRAEDR